MRGIIQSSAQQSLLGLLSLLRTTLSTELGVAQEPQDLARNKTKRIEPEIKGTKLLSQNTKEQESLLCKQI